MRLYETKATDLLQLGNVISEAISKSRSAGDKASSFAVFRKKECSKAHVSSIVSLVVSGILLLFHFPITQSLLNYCGYIHPRIENCNTAHQCFSYYLYALGVFFLLLGISKYFVVLSDQRLHGFSDMALEYQRKLNQISNDLRSKSVELSNKLYNQQSFSVYTLSKANGTLLQDVDSLQKRVQAESNHHNSIFYRLYLILKMLFVVFVVPTLLIFSVVVFLWLPNTAKYDMSRQPETSYETSDTATKQHSDTSIIRTLEPFTRIQFGNYTQQLSYGPMPVEWVVLSVDEPNNRALLFSRYVLNMRRYHGSYSYVSWAKCESRSWLNESFYNECFNKKEKAIILRTRNTSPYGDTTVTTEDYVFFLSAKEFREYVTHNQLLQGEATSLARSNDVYIEKGHCYWWLRGSSRRTNDADRVDLSGGLDLGGNTNAYGVGVRPAIWVKLDALMAELYEVR